MIEGVVSDGCAHASARRSFLGGIVGMRERELLRQFGQKKPLLIHDNWTREAERIADERYRSWEWNFGESPDFTF